MNEQTRRPLGPQPWPVLRDKLDQSIPFANMRDTPYYRDCIWEQFSAAEYKRRYDSLRAKMKEHKLDTVIMPGGPSHWSGGAGGAGRAGRGGGRARGGGGRGPGGGGPAGSGAM